MAPREAVIIESPYRGRDHLHTAAHAAYARACLTDSLDRGEAPYASHLLYTQVYDDTDPIQRKAGIEAGLSIGARLAATAVYLDHGVSEGMRFGVEAAAKADRMVHWRTLFLPMSGGETLTHGQATLDMLRQVSDLYLKVP